MMTNADTPILPPTTTTATATATATTTVHFIQAEIGAPLAPDSTLLPWNNNNGNNGNNGSVDGDGVLCVLAAMRRRQEDDGDKKQQQPSNDLASSTSSIAAAAALPSLLNRVDNNAFHPTNIADTILESVVEVHRVRSMEHIEAYTTTRQCQTTTAPYVDVYVFVYSLSNDDTSPSMWISAMKESVDSELHSDDEDGSKMAGDALLARMCRVKAIKRMQKNALAALLLYLIKENNRLLNEVAKPLQEILQQEQQNFTTTTAPPPPVLDAASVQWIRDNKQQVLECSTSTDVGTTEDDLDRFLAMTADQRQARFDNANDSMRNGPITVVAMTHLLGNILSEEIEGYVSEAKTDYLVDMTEEWPYKLIEQKLANDSSADASIAVTAFGDKVMQYADGLLRNMYRGGLYGCTKQVLRAERVLDTSKRSMHDAQRDFALVKVLSECHSVHRACAEEVDARREFKERLEQLVDARLNDELVRMVREENERRERWEQQQQQEQQLQLLDIDNGGGRGLCGRRVPDMHVRIPRFDSNIAAVDNRDWVLVDDDESDSAGASAASILVSEEDELLEMQKRELCVATERIKQLTTELDTARAEIEYAQTELEIERTERREELLAKCRDQVQQIRQSMQDELEREREEHRVALEVQKEESDRALQKVEKRMKMLLDETSAAAVESKKKLEEYSAHQLKSTRAEMDARVKNLQTQLAGTQSKAQEHEQKLRETKLQLESSVEECAKWKDQNNANQIMFHATRDKLRALEKESQEKLITLRKNHASELLELKEREKKLAQEKQTMVTEFEEVTKAFQEGNNRGSTEVLSLQKRVAECTALLQEKERHIEVQEAELQQSTQRYAELQEQLQVELKRRNSGEAQFQVELQQSAQRYAQTQAELQQIAQSYAQLQVELKQRKTSEAQLQVELQQSAQRCAQLQQQVQQVQEQSTQRYALLQEQAHTHLHQQMLQVQEQSTQRYTQLQQQMQQQMQQVQEQHKLRQREVEETVAEFTKRLHVKDAQLKEMQDALHSIRNNAQQQHQQNDSKKVEELQARLIKMSKVIEQQLEQLERSRAMQQIVEQVSDLLSMSNEEQETRYGQLHDQISQCVAEQVDNETSQSLAIKLGLLSTQIRQHCMITSVLLQPLEQVAQLLQQWNGDENDTLSLLARAVHRLLANNEHIDLLANRLVDPSGDISTSTPVIDGKPIAGNLLVFVRGSNENIWRAYSTSDEDQLYMSPESVAALKEKLGAQFKDHIAVHGRVVQVDRAERDPLKLGSNVTYDLVYTEIPDYL